MRIAFNTIALIGSIGVVLLAPQRASAADEFTCRMAYYECLASGIDVYTCRDEFYFCRGLPIPVRGGEPVARPE